MSYSEGERRSLKQIKMFNELNPERKLRVQLAVPNDAARSMNLTVRWNMRVPESSVVYAAFQNNLSDVTGEENLKSWTFSTGGSLPDCNVVVQARRMDEIVVAIIQSAQMSAIN